MKKTMNYQKFQALGYDGLTLRRRVDGFHQMRWFVEKVVHAGIARCVSAERDDLCDNPATHVYWQDQAEWYECCDEHAMPYPQWSGSTRWTGNVAAVNVIPDLAFKWLDTLDAEELKLIKLAPYIREA